MIKIWPLDSSHPEGLEYFCDEHLEAARSLAGLPSIFKIPPPRLWRTPPEEGNVKTAQWDRPLGFLSHGKKQADYTFSHGAFRLPSFLSNHVVQQ
jgi:hypothetical protein